MSSEKITRENMPANLAEFWEHFVGGAEGRLSPKEYLAFKSAFYAGASAAMGLITNGSSLEDLALESMKAAEEEMALHGKHKGTDYN